MNKRNHKILQRDKRNLEKRIERKHFDDQPETMFKDSNIVYEIGDRTRVIGYGGIGAIHKMVCKLKLDVGIDDKIDSAEDSRALPRVGLRPEHCVQRTLGRDVFRRH